MISSIQASGTNIQSYANTSSTFASTKIAGTKAATSTTVTEDEEGTVATSEQGDSVSISGQSLKIYSAQSANRPSETGTAEEGTYENAVASAVSSAAAGVGITEYTAMKDEAGVESSAVSSGSSSSDSTSDLSGYSEAELKEMLQNGEITQAEYNEEIKSRQQTTDSDDDETETAGAANVDEAEA